MKAKTEVRDVATPSGLARATWSRAKGPPRAALFLGHGAGGGIDAIDLVAIATACPLASIDVVRVEQPYRVANKAIFSDANRLDAAFRAVIEAERPQGVPLFVGGRSAGARVACRVAADVGAVGVVALAFPLRPPGKPQVSRLDELERAIHPKEGAETPVVIIQGSRDPFGSADDFPNGMRALRIEGADHSFKVLKSSGLSQAAVVDEVARAVTDFVMACCSAAPKRPKR